MRQPRASAGLCFDSGSRQAEQPGDSGRLGGLVNAPHVMVIQFEFEMSFDVDVSKNRLKRMEGLQSMIFRLRTDVKTQAHDVKDSVSQRFRGDTLRPFHARLVREQSYLRRAAHAMYPTYGG